MTVFLWIAFGVMYAGGIFVGFLISEIVSGLFHLGRDRRSAYWTLLSAAIGIAWPLSLIGVVLLMAYGAIRKAIDSEAVAKLGPPEKE